MSEQAAGGRREELTPIDELIPYARNARTHDEGQIADLARAIDELGWTASVFRDAQGIVAGHGRVMAARRLYAAGKTIRYAGSGEAIPRGTIPTLRCDGWTAAQRRAAILADNQLALRAGWDQALLGEELLGIGDAMAALAGFSADDMARALGQEPASGKAAGSLAAAFMVAPFSVLNAREGWWQERKRAWLALGIRSEVGRGAEGIDPDKLAPGGSPMVSGYSASGERLTRADQQARAPNGRRPDARLASDPDRMREHQVGAGMMGMHTQHGPSVTQNADGSLNYGEATGTSIFDPVLCEIAYRWFSPPGGLVLDPFAGGSVRGIVAAKLGRAYVGIDLSGRQLAANREQAADILSEDDPRLLWIEGDSAQIQQLVAPEVEADFVFSCPPYADLEVYSDDPRDLSTMSWADFRGAYRQCIAAACARLRQDRFACFVVGDVRDRRGNYLNFVGETVEAFRAAGLELYNEAILVTAAGSLPIRAGKQFSASRKLGKTHQNVLVFLKGDARRAVVACGAVEVDPSLLEEPAEPQPYGEPL